MFAFVEENSLKPLIAETFMFQDVISAIKSFSMGKHSGKIIINQFDAE
jgi:NADPH:quinone reductase-like Zn-dependent oxidoreductase